MYVSVICYQDKSICLLYENGKCVYTNKSIKKSLDKNNILDKENILPHIILIQICIKIKNYQQFR